MEEPEPPAPPPDLGITRVDLEGLVVIKVKPHVDLILGGIVAIMFIGVAIFLLSRGLSLEVLLPLLVTVPVLLLPVYVTLCSSELFVVSADTLEKRWSCKPFFWRTRILRQDIKTLELSSDLGNNGMIWAIDITLTNGDNLRLISGGNSPRLHQLTDYLQQALSLPPSPTASQDASDAS